MIKFDKVFIDDIEYFKIYSDNAFKILNIENNVVLDIMFDKEMPKNKYFEVN